jgi:hypothetical protein
MISTKELQSDCLDSVETIEQSGETSVNRTERIGLGQENPLAESVTNFADSVGKICFSYSALSSFEDVPAERNGW